MRKLFPLLLAAAALADAPKPLSTEEALVASVESAKFVDSNTPNSPKGSQGAMIGVDPHTKGATVYGKTPAGTGLPAHWHSFTEYTVLLSGQGTLTLDGKQHQVAPGGYLVIPPKMVHKFQCSPGADCLLLTRRGGPTDYHFVEK
ncbi:MAG: cupin domain-containing protein [Myxococcales bacterium]